MLNLCCTMTYISFCMLFSYVYFRAFPSFSKIGLNVTTLQTSCQQWWCGILSSCWHTTSFSPSNPRLTINLYIVSRGALERALVQNGTLGLTCFFYSPSKTNPLIFYTSFQTKNPDWNSKHWVITMQVWASNIPNDLYILHPSTNNILLFVRLWTFYVLSK